MGPRPVLQPLSYATRAVWAPEPGLAPTAPTSPTRPASWGAFLSVPFSLALLQVEISYPGSEVNAASSDKGAQSAFQTPRRVRGLFILCLKGRRCRFH